MHTGEKLFQCNICDISFSIKGTLKRHIESVHEGKKPFKCSECDAAFSNNQNLKSHISSVHGGKKSVMSVIQLFLKKQNLNKDMDSGHEGKF